MTSKPPVRVFVVLYTHFGWEKGDDDTTYLIGVFSQEEDADAVVKRRKAERNWHGVHNITAVNMDEVRDSEEGGRHAAIVSVQP